MKTRINLTIDPIISHRAKEAARKKGMSVSALVERMLAELAGARPKTVATPFSERWRGKMKVRTNGGSRADRLKKKYRLEG